MYLASEKKGENTMRLVKSLQKDFPERAPHMGKETSMPVSMLGWQGGWAGDVLGAAGPTWHGAPAVWTQEQRFLL